MSKLGSAIETEIIATKLNEAKPLYVERIEQQIKAENSRCEHHIARKYRTALKDVGADYEPWGIAERVNVARIVLDCIYPLGLFTWVRRDNARSTHYIQASTELYDYLSSYEQNIPTKLRYPVMLIPPKGWEDFYTGGYYTPEFQASHRMMSIHGMPRYMRKWVIENLSVGHAEIVKTAMNKAQNVPYKVNTKVLDIARKAFSNAKGILGLPPHGSAPKPKFPFSNDFKKEEANEQELEIFKNWKRLMKDWYTNDTVRNSKKLSILLKLNELISNKDLDRFYCPTFIDWRGRLYFKSTLNPQSADVIKGCMDFANGKRLGKEGLYWLKYQVATCAGYDKAHPDLRVQWCDEHWNEICNFLDNPL